MAADRRMTVGEHAISIFNKHDKDGSGALARESLHRRRMCGGVRRVGAAGLVRQPWHAVRLGCLCTEPGLLSR